MPGTDDLTGARSTVHATAIAVGSAAALIRGPSGCGKSDLALRCLAVPTVDFFGQRAAVLVADDQVIVTPAGGRLQLSAPPAIKGLIEVRGLGILTMPTVDTAHLVLVVDLVAPTAVERLPKVAFVSLLGHRVRHLRLTPFEASAPIKLLLGIKEAST